MASSSARRRLQCPQCSTNSCSPGLSHTVEMSRHCPAGCPGKQKPHDCTRVRGINMAPLIHEVGRWKRDTKKDFFAPKILAQSRICKITKSWDAVHRWTGCRESLVDRGRHTQHGTKEHGRGEAEPSDHMLACPFPAKPTWWHSRRQEATA